LGRALAGLFYTVALVDCQPLFQTNHLVQVLRGVLVERELDYQLGERRVLFDVGIGTVLAIVSEVIISGGLGRIAATAARVVPLMTLLYVGAGLFVIARNVAVAPAVLARIAVLAFDPAATHGRLLGLILISVQRGAFSNEAWIGPKDLAHGA
jgi:AGCS family alanine or glycine:cation symporter